MYNNYIKRKKNMKKLIMLLTLMSVVMFFATETKGQTKDTTIINIADGVLVGVRAGHVKTPADWYLGVSSEALVSYTFKSQEEDKYTQSIIVNLELGRAAGRYYNAVGYNPLNRTLYSLNVYTAAKWKFPLELFAYGEYSWKKIDGVTAGGFISVGPQTKLADEKCILALTFGSPTSTWDPSIGMLVVIPLMTKL